jgi:hypothetical protein
MATRTSVERSDLNLERTYHYPHPYRDTSVSIIAVRWCSGSRIVSRESDLFACESAQFNDLFGVQSLMYYAYFFFIEFSP